MAIKKFDGKDLHDIATHLEDLSQTVNTEYNNINTALTGDTGIKGTAGEEFAPLIKTALDNAQGKMVDSLNAISEDIIAKNKEQQNLYDYVETTFTAENPSAYK